MSAVTANGIQIEEILETLMFMVLGGMFVLIHP